MEASGPRVMASEVIFLKAYSGYLLRIVGQDREGSRPIGR